MFTGLIEEMGEIANISRSRGAQKLTISASKIMDDLKIDDSVSVDGVCLTVVSRDSHSFSVEAVEETLKKTTLGALKLRQKVNLERALRAGDRLGGHFVQGHVDGVGKVAAWQNQQGGKLLTLRAPQEITKYAIPKGSITVNGVSLTIASLQNSQISIALIPHTLAVTTLGALKPGDAVNLEADMLGKYVHHLLPQAEKGDGLKFAHLTVEQS